MNNDKSNIKGSNVRRAVIFLLLAGFCVALFAPHAAASQWSPTKTFPDRDRIVIRPEYDDGGWGGTQSSPVDVWMIFRTSYYPSTLYWLFEILPDLDRGDDGVTNPDDHNNDPDADPHRTTSSD